MALAKNVNSYVTVAEADAYFADRLDADAWTSAEATTKAKALVTATGQLDQMSWVGVAVSETQKLAFPRSGEYYDPKLGMRIALSGIPDRLVVAVCELAMHLVANEGVLASESSVKSISVDVIKLDFIQPAAVIPDTVHRVIKPLLVSGGSRQWWRAN